MIQNKNYCKQIKEYLKEHVLHFRDSGKRFTILTNDIFVEFIFVKQDLSDLLHFYKFVTYLKKDVKTFYKNECKSEFMIYNRVLYMTQKEINRHIDDFLFDDSCKYIECEKMQ